MFVIVIDDKNRLEPVVAEAVERFGVQIKAVPQLAAGKRLMIEHQPQVVVCNSVLGDDLSAGFRFCQELRAHASFADLPVILVCEELTEDVIRQASDAGAKGLLAWPVSAEALGKRILPILGIEASEVDVASAEQVEEQNPEKQTRDMPAATSVASEDELTEKKLKTAQHLLASVLHNLRTSNLLEVADLEDVPRVVLQMTRTVCGITNEAAAEPAQVNQKKSSDDVQLDLDSVFGLKK